METLRNGLKAGLKTTWTLGKIIFPITILVVILQHTPILPWIVKLISPFMGIFGLSGEAAIPLVLGNALNLYAGIAGILSLELTVKEVFILAVMLSFSHNIFIETGVALKVGVKLWVVLVVRFGLAAFSAIIINLFWKGGGEIAKYGMAPEVTAVPEWVAGNRFARFTESVVRRIAACTYCHSTHDHCPIFERPSLFTEVLGKTCSVHEGDRCTTERINDVSRRPCHRPCLWCRRHDPSGAGGWRQQKGCDARFHISDSLSRGR